MQSIVQTGLINAAMATLLALAVFTLTRFWRAPPIVYALWLLVLARLVSPPLIELSILGYLHPYLPSPEVIGTAQVPGPSAGPIALDRWGPGFSLDIERDGPSAGGGVGATGLTARQSDAWTTWIFLIWLTGSASSLLINGRRIVRFHRLIRFTPRAPGNLRARVSRIAGDLGLKRCPDVHLIEAPVCPMVWSLGSSPKLLLPVGLVARLDDEELSTLLAHELAHLRRRDHWVRWFEFFVRTLYWWNPVAWWAQRELHLAEEQCCDAWVLEAFPEKSEAYGKALLKALCYASEIQPQLPSIASGIGATQSIRRRLKMIASMRTKRSLSALERSTLVLAAALALPFFPAFAQQADEQPEEGRAREITFYKDINPLIQRNCFGCHPGIPLTNVAEVRPWGRVSQYLIQNPSIYENHAHFGDPLPAVNAEDQLTFELWIRGRLVIVSDVPGRVSYEQDIKPLIERNCLECHNKTPIGMSFDVYREVRPWAKAIGRLIGSEDLYSSHGGTQLERLLSKEAVATIRAWVSLGSPEGELVDLTPPGFEQSGKTTILNDRLQFSLPDLQGNVISSSDLRFRNKIVIVDVWGTWCGPCIAALPHLESLYQKYRQAGIEIVGIAYENSDNPSRRRAMIRAMQEEYGITYTLLDGGEKEDGIQRTLPAIQGFEAYPTTIFIDKSGVVRNVHVGFIAGQEVPFELMIRALLFERRVP